MSESEWAMQKVRTLKKKFINDQHWVLPIVSASGMILLFRPIGLYEYDVN